MEIKVSEIKELAPVIITNYDELKSQLVEKVNTYKNMVYSDENIKQAKSDRAALNKLSKAIGDERKRVKDLLLDPYKDFETKCKELETIVDEASKNVDIQIKAFEEKEDSAKLQEIVTYFISVVGEFSSLLDFDIIFNDKWLNKTYGMDKIKQDIDHIIAKAKTDIECIDAQLEDINIRKQVKDFYFRNIANPSVLSLSLQEGARIKETNRKITDLEDKKAETNTETASVKTENKDDKKYLLIVDFRAYLENREQFDNLKKCFLENKIKIEKI